MAAKKSEDNVDDIEIVDEPQNRNPKAVPYGPADAQVLPAAMGATFAERAKARAKLVKTDEAVSK